MTPTTQGLGGLLIVVGVIAYVVTDMASVTALIPAILGLAILVCGLLAGRDALHRHAIHAALVLALLGVLGSLPMVIDLVTGSAERPAAAIASTITAVACLLYVVAGVRSFVAARQARG